MARALKIERRGAINPGPCVTLLAGKIGQGGSHIKAGKCRRRQGNFLKSARNLTKQIIK